MTKIESDKQSNKSLIAQVLILSFVIILLLINLLQFINPFAPKGIVIGEFLKGETEGYGEFCGQYPYTKIRLINATYNKEHFYNDKWFYFGNQFNEVNNLVIGNVYKISYHEESRPSDTTSGNTVYFWVIDNICKEE